MMAIPTMIGAKPIREWRRGSVLAIFKLPSFIFCFAELISGIKERLPVLTLKSSAIKR